MKRHKLKRGAGYIVGGALFVLGVYGLISELVDRRTSGDILFGYVLAGLFISSGILLCSAVRVRYAGGFWFPLGVVLLFGGVAGFTLELENLFRGTEHQALRGGLIGAVLLVAGGSCLFLGHLRHQHKHRGLQSDSAQD